MQHERGRDKKKRDEVCKKMKRSIKRNRGVQLSQTKEYN